MATINLGRVKPVFRGAYNNSTAYVVDDIVTSSDETFICIQASTGNATSNATYWTKLAAKGTNGTNGTDVGTVITTQGDILYRDGSGLARLGAGTSGYFLKTQGTGANPVWSEVVSGNSPSFLAYMSGNQTGYARNTWYDIPFDTEKWDTDNALSVSNTDNYQFVVPSGKAGKYLFDGYVRWYGASSGHSTANTWSVKLRHKPSGGSYANHAEQSTRQEPDINAEGFHFNFGIDLAVGDAVNVQMHVDVSQNTYNVAGASVYETFWKGMKIG